MSATSDLQVPFVRSIFHPSDFSEESDSAFAHALAIALIRKTQLTLLHATRDFLAEDEWTKFPPVRATLERWGLLEKGSPRSAIFQELAVRVKKVSARSLTPVSAILHYLERHPTDLIVLATEGRGGLPRWLRPSVAERVARRAETMTLFVPGRSRGIVSLRDGEISIRRILVPVDHRPNPQGAVLRATRATAMTESAVEIHLLHVGEDSEWPEMELPESPSWSWQTLRRRGDVIDEITRAAEEVEADLIVMATEGQQGILDALRGSVTEQVLRRVECPLLAVPADPPASTT